MTLKNEQGNHSARKPPKLRGVFNFDFRKKKLGILSER